MKKILFLLTCIVIILLSEGVALAEAAIIDVDEQYEGAELLSSPSGSLIGLYFPGTVVDILDDQSGWAYVRIGNDKLNVEGYMNADFLQSPSATKFESRILIAEIAGGEECAPLFELPDPLSLQFGSFLNDTKVALIGEIDSFYHVIMGNRQGFILKDHLSLVGRTVSPDMYAGIPEEGYAYLDGAVSPQLMEFPFEESPVLDHPWLDSTQGLVTDYAIQVIACLGDWYQVRIQDENYVGFIKANHFNRFIDTQSWILNDKTLYPTGNYCVGTDYRLQCVRPYLYDDWWRAGYQHYYIGYHDLQLGFCKPRFWLGIGGQCHSARYCAGVLSAGSGEAKRHYHHGAHSGY